MRNLEQSHKVIIASILISGVLFAGSVAMASGQDQYGNEDPNKKILKSGLLGAGTGAIASSASGGDAGKGALIGAGTNVIGGALLDMLSGPSQPAQPQYTSAPQYAPAPSYSQQQYAPAPAYDNRQPTYYQQAPVYQAPQPNPSTQILKQGLLGAGTGAIASSVSGGNAGTGALVGAGTNVIGGALLDTLTTPSQPAQPVYYQQQPQYYQQQPQYSQQQGYGSSSQPLQKKIIRKYDSEGNVVSEEEIYS